MVMEEHQLLLLERIRVERPLSSEEVSLHVGVSVTGTDVTITETVTSSDSEFHTVEELVPATRSITFRSTDEEWANVYLDGRKVWEIRAMDREKTITVATGEHTLEIRDFMENETWCKGRLFVDGRTDLIVGITEDQPVEVYNDRFAFGP